MLSLKLLGVIWFIALLGLANMAPVFFKKIPILGAPIDRGKTWRGKRIFGNNKTWRGIIAAILVGFLFFLLQRYLFSRWSFFGTISITNYLALPWFFGALVGGGAIVGDLIKSFFKRRFNVPAGKSWIPFDQIDYLLGGLLATALFFIPSPAEIFLIIVVGFFLHLLFKALGFALKVGDKAI